MKINSNNNDIRYEIYAENRGGQLIIKNIGGGGYFSRTAFEILAQQEILLGFSKEHAAYIGFIAGMTAG
jgi:hypothetical protein